MSARRDGVRAIRGQPTLGIDPDVVGWALRVADLLERRADLIARSRSPALVAEAFMRGLSGDPFGAAVELGRDERALIDATREHVQARHHLRATLTARHGVEFP